MRNELRDLRKEEKIMKEVKLRITDSILRRTYIPCMMP